MLFSAVTLFLDVIEDSQCPAKEAALEGKSDVVQSSATGLMDFSTIHKCHIIKYKQVLYQSVLSVHGVDRMYRYEHKTDNS